MKTKVILLVIATLIIGFALGMLTSAQLRLHRLKPVKVYFSEERFREGFFKTIQPNDQQKAEIEQILDKYARRNGTLQSNFRHDLDNMMDEFRREVDSKLSKEQIARLKELEERRQKMIKEYWKKHENDTVNRGWHGRMGPPQHSFPSDSSSISK
jgi:hypothetical protein